MNINIDKLTELIQTQRDKTFCPHDYYQQQMDEGIDVSDTMPTIECTCGNFDKIIDYLESDEVTSGPTDFDDARFLLENFVYQNDQSGDFAFTDSEITALAKDEGVQRSIKHCSNTDYHIDIVRDWIRKNFNLDDDDQITRKADQETIEDTLREDTNERLLYCNTCDEGTPYKDMGYVYGQYCCITCADGMGEKLTSRGCIA